MSVSQMKKQFEEFALYLGRDTSGQEKLKKLKDEFGKLRTQLASAEAKSASAAEVSEGMRIRMQTAERELVNSQRENARLSQIVENLSRDLALANARVAAATATESETDDAPAMVEERELKQVMKQLRAKLRHCPLATRRFRDNSVAEHPLVWDRESIAKGWSHDALWTLGAAVAALVAMDETVVLETKRTIKNSVTVRTDTNSDASVSRQLVQWLGKNIDLAQETRRAGIARVKNCIPDGLLPGVDY